MPTQKQINEKIARKVAESSFWNGEIFCTAMHSFQQSHLLHSDQVMPDRFFRDIEFLCQLTDFDIAVFLQFFRDQR